MAFASGFQDTSWEINPLSCILCYSPAFLSPPLPWWPILPISHNTLHSFLLPLIVFLPLTIPPAFSLPFPILQPFVRIPLSGPDTTTPYPDVSSTSLPSSHTQLLLSGLLPGHQNNPWKGLRMSLLPRCTISLPPFPLFSEHKYFLQGCCQLHIQECFRPFC